MNLTASVRGDLFQETIVRFKPKPKHALGSHQLAVGDSVRISRFVDGRTSKTKDIVGVVLDRRARNIDVCIQISDASFIRNEDAYRLDCSVNKIAYERTNAAISALSLTTQQEMDKRQLESSEDCLGGHDISHAIRDLVIYSYPNSMLQLAQSPGGLRAALPYIPTSSHSPSHSTTNEDASQGPIFRTHEKLRHLAGMVSLDDFSDEDSEDSDSGALYSPLAYTAAEIDRALHELRKIQSKRGLAPLNDSQIEAMRGVLQGQPISLIQGPPGTGKVCKFYFLFPIIGT